jgi:hypothetical protein
LPDSGRNGDDQETKIDQHNGWPANTQAQVDRDPSGCRLCPLFWQASYYKLRRIALHEGGPDGSVLVFVKPIRVRLGHYLKQLAEKVGFDVF